MPPSVLPIQFLWTDPRHTDAALGESQIAVFVMLKSLIRATLAR